MKKNGFCIKGTPNEVLKELERLGEILGMSVSMETVLNLKRSGRV